MKLKEFVRQSLLEITEGVTAAQADSLLAIAPGSIEEQINLLPSPVHFEVSVTVNSEAGGGISVWSVGDAKAARSSEHVNKISFDVPVYFQAPTERNPKNKSRRLSSSSGDNS